MDRMPPQNVQPQSGRMPIQQLSPQSGPAPTQNIQPQTGRVLPQTGQMPPQQVPPQTGQMPPQQVPLQSAPVPTQNIPSISMRERHRLALMGGLSAGERQNPSPLVASVIAHREEAVRRHTSGLEAYSAQQKKQQEAQQKPAQPPRATSSKRKRRGILRKSVPVVLQMSAVECGAACLAMILRYYGRKTSISEISERVGIGRDGLSALGIVKTARDYGLRVRALSLRDNDFSSVNLPAIVHWQFNHFLIVERWSLNYVDVVDPASGRKRLPAEEFDAGFTGVVITLEPGVQFVRHTNTPQVTLGTYVTQYLKRAPLVFVQLIAASLVLQLFGLAFPLLTKIVVDQVIPFKVNDILPFLGVGMIVILVAQLITMLLRGSLLVYLQTRIDTHIMPSFFEHMLTLPQSFFQKRSSGDILTRITSNTIIRDIISNQLVSAFLDGSLVLSYLVILLTQSLVFGLLVLGIGLLQVVLLLGTNNSMRALTRRELEATGKTQGYVAEVLNGISTLKAAGGEQRAFARWINLFVDQLNTTVHLDYLASTVNSFMTTLSTLSPLILLWYGTVQVLGGTMQVGTMLALTALATAFLNPLASLVSSGQELQVVQSHLERIGDVLNAQPEQDIQRVQQPPQLTGRIGLEHVSFRYDANSPLVLKDISVRIEAGQKIAIVGRTGSGKSTLGRLLLGLCLPTEGEIYYDSIPLRFLNYQAVRSQFGVVIQDSAIFSGSVRENIAFNAPDIGMERIIRAAQMADVHDDIMQMPMGYETYVSEGGS
ncbi:MAG: ATP-binding cassette domain-containing protein, partial [Chloroflexi bacterium]|nr:ATP-binding cassette domain-containing protein [Chloroflexota bacterium]